MLYMLSKTIINDAILCNTALQIVSPYSILNIYNTGKTVKINLNTLLTRAIIDTELVDQ